MRKLYFLLPGTTGKYICGGLFAELKAYELAKQVCLAEVVTYRQREPNRLFIDDLLKGTTQQDGLDADQALSQNLKQSIFVVSWGFDAVMLARRLRSHNVIYHAHSAEYGFRLPANVPIITVSRNTMGYWGQRSSNSLIYYLPNQISDEFYNFQLDRDIDVLVQVRKSSEYLIQHLIPELKTQCNVYVVDQFVDDLATLFNRTKVYLYDSAEYWAQQGVTEGFGLQPLEAMACGCQVFSSVNHGLSDYLDPGFNCHKIAGYSMDFDLRRILQVAQAWQPCNLPPAVLSEYREANIRNRWQIILTEINEYFDQALLSHTKIPDLTNHQILRLNTKRFLGKVKKKLWAN